MCGEGLKVILETELHVARAYTVPQPGNLSEVGCPEAGRTGVGVGITKHGRVRRVIRLKTKLEPLPIRHAELLALCEEDQAKVVVLDRETQLAIEEAEVLIFEPSEVINTGDARVSDFTAPQGQMI